MKHQLRPVAQSPRQLSYGADSGIPRFRCKPQHRFLVSLKVANCDVRESVMSLAEKFSRSTVFFIYTSRLVAGLGVRLDGVHASYLRGLDLFGPRRAGRPLAAAILCGNRRPTSVELLLQGGESLPPVSNRLFELFGGVVSIGVCGNSSDAGRGGCPEDDHRYVA